MAATPTQPASWLRLKSWRGSGILHPVANSSPSTDSSSSPALQGQFAGRPPISKGTTLGRRSTETLRTRRSLPSFPGLHSSILGGHQCWLAWLDYQTSLSTVKAYARHLEERLWGFFNAYSPWFLAVPSSWDELWDLFLPAQQLLPAFRAETFNEIARILDEQESIGIAFNTYNPQSGREYLHVNAAGLERIKEYNKKAAFGAQYRDTVYKKITPEYIRAALWLVQYGFKEKFEGEHLIDGAYYRDVILNELTFADRIYIPRPINPQWLGRMPRNLFETEDLKIELWFGGAYHRQYRLIEQTNEWLKGHKGWQLVRMQNVPVEEAANYTHIDLVEVPITTQRGFFDYFLENVEVFERAYLDSKEKLSS